MVKIRGQKQEVEEVKIKPGQPIFLTKEIRWLIFTAALIFSQNMITVSSQIAVGDWEFWTTWKDYGFFILPISWIAATHFPVISYVFKRFFNVYGGATMATLLWMAQRFIMVWMFFSLAEGYPLTFVLPPVYILGAIAADLLILFFYNFKGMYLIISGAASSLLALLGSYWFDDTPWLTQVVRYPDPLHPGTYYTMPMYALINMVIQRAPIPAYITYQWTWITPERSFYQPIVIAALTAAIMGVIWAGFAYIFLWGILKLYDNGMKYVRKLPPPEDLVPAEYLAEEQKRR